ncbi:MAG: 16S rRNA (guanine(966)-N(2))-methyltransferase RsmD [Alphaproteobacteria bacterium]
MRIVGGRHGGRRLEAPLGRRLRPTADRGRESVFNILAHGSARIGGAESLTGALVLDGFAGTGAFGLEAISRGAAFATLMDNNREALDFCRTNAAALGEQAQVTVLHGDCLNPVRPPDACSLVFLDPPYRKGLAAPALEALAASGWVADGALVVIELAAKEDFTPPAGAELLDERRYGAARILFLRWTG